MNRYQMVFRGNIVSAEVAVAAIFKFCSLISRKNFREPVCQYRVQVLRIDID